MAHSRPGGTTGHFPKAGIWLKVNGVTKQNANLSQMIWSVAEQISKLSEANELFPGDIIYSGTPENVGPVSAWRCDPPHRRPARPGHQDRLMQRRHFTQWLAAAAGAALPGRAADELPLFDAHVHYSHDAWELVPPKQAVEILRKAGLKGVLVSSSNNKGTQMLLAEAPDLIVAELRPYRLRSDVSTWVRDPAIVRYMEERLARYRYVGIGEFHLYGEEATPGAPAHGGPGARTRPGAACPLGRGRGGASVQAMARCAGALGPFGL